jgi:hypothetical protein
MTPLRSVLALDEEQPICADCATALGGRPVFKILTVTARPCGHCGVIRECTAVRDYEFPASLIRPDRRADADDYSELEAYLGRRT